MKKEWLSGELGDLEGIMYQDPETGKRTIILIVYLALHFSY